MFICILFRRRSIKAPDFFLKIRLNATCAHYCVCRMRHTPLNEPLVICAPLVLLVFFEPVFAIRLRRTGQHNFKAMHLESLLYSLRCTKPFRLNAPMAQNGTQTQVCFYIEKLPQTT